MAETYQIQANTPAARGPSANAYTVLFTTTQETVTSVHICNTTGADAKFRVALVESGYVLPGDNSPALYQFVYYNEPIEAERAITLTAFTLGIGVRIVVFTDTAGVTFVGAGPQM